MTTNTMAVMKYAMKWPLDGASGAFKFLPAALELAIWLTPENTQRGGNQIIGILRTGCSFRGQ